MGELKLFTASYRRYQANMGVPVRTSNGYPRFVRYRISHSLKAAMPDRETINMTDQAEFERLYRRKLNAIGSDAVMAQLRAIAADAWGDDTRLVLMCFEDLAQPDTWCHRSTLGEWITEQTDLEVVELDPNAEGLW